MVEGFLQIRMTHVASEKEVVKESGRLGSEELRLLNFGHIKDTFHCDEVVRYSVYIWYCIYFQIH